MKFKDTRIGVFAYNFPHKKTSDFLYRMLTEGIPISVILAADPVQLNIPAPSVRTKVRHQELPHPAEIAARFGIKYVVCPHNSAEVLETIREYDLEIGIIAGARILKQNVIDAFPKGVINFHPGLLPEIRGLDALLWSIEKDVPLAITSHLIDGRVDAGLLIEQNIIPLHPDDTMFDLTERLHEMQLPMIGRAVEKVLAGDIRPLNIAVPYNRKLSSEMEKAVLAKFPDYLARHSSGGQKPVAPVPAPSYRVHPSAVLDEGCVIGNGVNIWHFTHVMKGARIGDGCNIGQNVVVSTGVRIGSNVRIQNNVSVYEGVTLEDNVFLGPSMVFTNVNNPRSAVNRKDQFRPTLVRKGASIGANATIVCGNEIGEYAFVGAGAVVTKPVQPYALVVGNPARQIGWMSELGNRLHFDKENRAVCPESNETYQLSSQGVIKIS
ncbi:MAG: N-acetyltransferase [Flaviaesturariibacter sp.]|nr:N-acetyltransferase [Flaviaesturariibacter sp.]